MPCAASASSTAPASARSSSLRATNPKGRSTKDEGGGRPPVTGGVSRRMSSFSLGEQQQSQASRQQLLPNFLPGIIPVAQKWGQRLARAQDQDALRAGCADAHRAVAVLRL